MALVTSFAATVIASPLYAVLTQDGEMTEEELANRMPGLPAFIVFAVLAVALYFLLRNMNQRLRRMSYREREREAHEAELERQRSAEAEAEKKAEPDERDER